MAARTAADVRWLNAAFAKADADNAHSVVIIGQADMWDTSDAAAHQTNYEPIIKAMADNAKAYGKPVLYLNGDSHVYRSDNPLEQGSTCYTETGACTGDAWNQHPFYDVPNFHRIVVHGSTFPLEWLKLSIDPRAAWENKPHADLVGPVQLAAGDAGAADADFVRRRPFTCYSLRLTDRPARGRVASRERRCRREYDEAARSPDGHRP